MENGRRDFERQKKICKQNALERNEQLVKAVEKCSKKLLELATGTDVVAEEEAQLYVHQEKLEVLASEIRLLKEALTELAEAYQQADGAFQRCNEHFMEVCEISSIDPSKLRSTREKRKLQELAETFEKEDITRDSEALELQITQEIAKLQVSGVVGTENDVVRHREALSDKERIEAELQEKMQAMNNNAAQLSAKLDAWKNPVSQLVDKISENFKKFFTQLECIGEVKLNVPEREYDMEQYGIDIYVKFRENAELRRLDDKSQSGGERSVSTMLYMLALQELCPVPFRCVDEINQGMDPRNERKVFEMMLDILASEGSPGQDTVLPADSETSARTPLQREGPRRNHLQLTARRPR
ncbi:hypothetical protein L596_027297 [Steinernema carpocapsae]|uniref:Structural maintenance of chromosomes protein 5 n=1 Tax=Steinernema carpocapsae TaxID=34508 RepID=A0A4U5M3Y5_STECR|nr:hypothetical protein L596_027297 [Steinernema carpocapsae]